MSEEVAAPETGAEAPAAAQPEGQAPVADAPQAQPDIPEQPQEQPQENKARERLNLRFSELTAQRNAAEERAQRAEREAAELRARGQAYDEPQQYNDPSDPQYIEAVVQRAIERDRQQQQQRAAQQTQAQQAQSLRTTLLESGLDGAAVVAMDENFPFTHAMAEALAVSERPAVVADHLGNNPQEAARIAALPPSRQGFELARLEARLASQPRTTNAPPPPSTVGARATASVDPKAMSMEQYIAARSSGQI
jgi:hypothetical protein